MTVPEPHAPRPFALSEALGFLPIAGLRRWLGHRDPEEARTLGARWGRRVAAVGGQVTDLSRINMSLAFPDEAVAFRERLLSDSFANLGMGLAELALMQGRHAESVIDAVRLQGEEHLVRGEDSGPGALVVTAHFGSWDLYAAAISRRYPLTVVHRGFRNERVTEMMTRVRLAGGGDLEEIRMGPRAVPALLGALRRGRYCVLLMDQNARAQEGVFVPFFSRPACTRSAPAVIAMRRKVPVYPVFGHREGLGGRHVVEIGRPLAIDEVAKDAPVAVFDAAVQSNVARMTSAIEEAIRTHPDQWIWSQRRWKTQPMDERPAAASPLYPSRDNFLRRVRHRLRA